MHNQQTDSLTVGEGPDDLFLPRLSIFQPTAIIYTFSYYLTPNFGMNHEINKVIPSKADAKSSFKSSFTFNFQKLGKSLKAPLPNGHS